MSARKRALPPVAVGDRVLLLVERLGAFPARFPPGTYCVVEEVHLGHPKQIPPYRVRALDTDAPAYGWLMHRHEIATVAECLAAMKVKP